MEFLIVALLAVSVLMPLFYTYRVFALAEASKAGWLIAVAEATAFVSLVFLLGRWDIAGIYMRYLLLGLFVAAVFWSLRAHLSCPWRPVAGALRGHRATLVTLALFSAALLYILSGMLPPSNLRSLAFPMEGGRFVAAQAGTIGLLNHHADHPEQRFATDITAIYPSGFRARGILPRSLDDYAVFGEPVVSPCAGEVVVARGDLPDLIPPKRDRKNIRGNHVILACGDLQIELAHLMRGSVAVEVGDRVSVGDPLGRVGNSGNTTEPHLHIHAVDPANDTGVPVTFDGRFLVRNSVFPGPALPACCDFLVRAVLLTRDKDAVGL